MYCQRVRLAIGRLTVTLGGIDALVFTAGAGEHSAKFRDSISQGLKCIGLEIDQEVNRTCQPDTDIATKDSVGRVLVIKTHEDLTMLREVLNLLMCEGDNISLLLSWQVTHGNTRQRFN